MFSLGLTGGGLPSVKLWDTKESEGSPMCFISKVILEGWASRVSGPPTLSPELAWDE